MDVLSAPKTCQWNSPSGVLQLIQLMPKVQRFKSGIPKIGTKIIIVSVAASFFWWLDSHCQCCWSAKGCIFNAGKKRGFLLVWVWGGVRVGLAITFMSGCRRYGLRRWWSFTGNYCYDDELANTMLLLCPWPFVRTCCYADKVAYIYIIYTHSLQVRHCGGAGLQGVVTMTYSISCDVDLERVSFFEFWPTSQGQLDWSMISSGTVCAACAVVPQCRPQLVEQDARSACRVKAWSHIHCSVLNGVMIWNIDSRPAWSWFVNSAVRTPHARSLKQKNEIPL